MPHPPTPLVCCGSLGFRHRKHCPTLQETNPQTVEESSKVETVLVPPPSDEILLKRIADLEQRNEENQKKLEMLYAVADKGRIFNYENGQKEKKPLRVKLSICNEKIVVGWRTVKDELITDPRTGTVVGETQQYELLLLDKENVTSKETINNYINFSNARYDQRIECEVIGRREDYEGRLTFDLQLPDGRTLSIDGKFIN